MARNVKTIRTRNETNRATVEGMDADELKVVVRDGLVAMNLTDREGFIKALEAEMRTVNLNMRSYLVPLGIPARTLEELTPTEVGHLVRYLKINVQHAMPAVERAISKYSAITEKNRRSGDRLAA
jgi:hypothetical protein